jgi:bifunctional non-homologous end joining protein LigD
MPLEEYRKKRDFDQTAEPEGKDSQAGDGKLRFVVQKHAATRLHYDLRLELDGVLKSWAVPKGPSLNPKDKRLAKMTEDHPFDYRHFEGVIPKGSYGAGTMIIWDEGVYQAPGAGSREESENSLREGLENGNLKFTLEGKKLQGEYALVRMKDDNGDNWLLIKKNDEFASSEDVLEQSQSVRSGSSLEEIREIDEARRKGWQGWDAGELEQLKTLGIKKSKMPSEVRPMLASLTEAAFDRPEWFFEIKWDGYRAVAEIQKNSVQLYSRNLLSFKDKFAPVVKELEKIDFEVVLDGEVVVVDDEGRALFKLLQQYRNTGEGLLVYYVFDLLYLDGWDLQALPLEKRKEILRRTLPELPRLKYSDHIEGKGKDLYLAAQKKGIEGIIAKDKNSRYRQGVRSSEWLKVKAKLQQKAVIGGYTEPKGSRKDLGALLLGVYEGKDLVYIGHTGGGFDAKELKEVKAKLEPLKRKKSPFKQKPKTNAPATWVEPELVCEVRFSEWSHDMIMRQPIYLGMREDVDPAQIRREVPLPEEEVHKKKYAIQEDEKSTVHVDGIEISISNLNKMYWPEDKLTKGDMIEYYREIAPVLLRYLKDRPQSLHRFPDGIHGNSFFQKDFPNAPDWVETIPLQSDSNSDPTNYILCQNTASLLYMANLGSIEIHPWNSRKQKLDSPDYLVIDLDPSDRPFEDVIRVALVVRDSLEELDIISFIKTTGQRGMHVFIPTGAKYSYEQTRQFAQLLCQYIHSKEPEITSLERKPKNRQGLIYLDYLQNKKGATLAAAYSLRPRAKAPVSTPLKWEEVRKGISPQDYNLRNTLKRVEKLGDLWEGVLGPAIDMEKGLSTLKKVWSSKSNKRP